MTKAEREATYESIRRRHARGDGPRQIAEALGMSLSKLRGWYTRLELPWELDTTGYWRESETVRAAARKESKRFFFGRRIKDR